MEVAFNREWAEAVFADRSSIKQNRIGIVREEVAGDTKINRSTTNGPISLHGKTYQHGIGVNSYSVMRVTLAQPADRFVADIGLDDNTKALTAGGTVAFHVSVAGKDIFSTPVMRWADGVKSIDVPLNGAQEFDITVDEGGDGRGWDQANWADAKVILKDGTQLWLDEMFKKWQLGTEIPFSFVYGGKKSSELIGSWKREIQQEPAGAGRLLRTLTLTDPVTGLEVKALCTIYTDCAGVDWTLHFTNKGKADTPAIEQVKAVDVSIWPDLSGKAPVLHRLNGGGGGVDDWMPFDEPVAMGKRIEFAPLAGRSSMGVCPFFNLDWGEAGVITAIGWTGQWEASVGYTSGTLQLSAGMRHQHLSLKPGESIRSPRVTQLYWQGGDEARSYNLFREMMLKHVAPTHNGEPVTPPIAHLTTAFYEFDNGTEADVLSHLNAMKGLGFEFLWLDAYYGKDVFPKVGNYVLPIERGLDLKRFPRGIKPIADATHKAGMKFLMWFEFERICGGTLMATEHPEWVVLPDPNGWGMLNLGLPETREFMTKFFNTVIKDYGIECIRIDNAVGYEGLWGSLDAKAGTDRVGMAEIRYVEGLYRLMDDVLAANPGLFFDNCASGGCRVDLEMCHRSIPIWRTDATITPLFQRDFHQAALQNQVMTAGLSRYMPFNASGQMGADPYNFRSGFNGGISFCEDIRPAAYPRALLKQAIAEGKRIRKYFSGNMYVLTEVTVSPKFWQVVQYHRPDKQDGLVMLFRRHKSAYSGYTLDLREIEPTAKYSVTVSRNYNRPAPQVMTGSELKSLNLLAVECPDSFVVEYARIS